MVKKISKLPRTNNFISFENIVGVLLAILIIFDLKLEEPICNLINTNAGKIVSFIIVILLFLYIHPIIGILFLIYLYQCINTTNYTYSEQNKYQVLQQLNPPKTFNVEEEVILNVAPIKNQNQNSNVNFTDYLNNNLTEV